MLLIRLRKLRFLFEKLCVLCDSEAGQLAIFPQELYEVWSELEPMVKGIVLGILFFLCTGEVKVKAVLGKGYADSLFKLSCFDECLYAIIFGVDELEHIKLVSDNNERHFCWVILGQL